MQMCSFNRISCLIYFLIVIILCGRHRREEGEREGSRVHVPLAQHVKHRKSLSGRRQLLLLLQASLSPDECCVGLLGVKRDVG